MIEVTLTVEKTINFDRFMPPDVFSFVCVWATDIVFRDHGWSIQVGCRHCRVVV